MGTEERREMLFWTREEYTKFSEAMMYARVFMGGQPNEILDKKRKRCGPGH